MNEFHIPVEPAIQRFSEHLRCHPRTILSAKYGDGKSYFLDSFINDENVKKEYQFIKIYPVNYQVLENQDIFDVVKYDILLQLGLNDMLDESVEISARDAFLFCMKTKGLDLVGGLFDIAGSIEGAPNVKAIGKIGSAATKLVINIQDALKDYREYKNGELGIIDKYIEKVDEISIYEEDPVTKIIQKGIAAWREKEGNKDKRVVLLFEDMDRIDPAHLFRILNIFSAHMDFTYRYQINPEQSLMGNKFGVDNVVMVIHYENLESIFHHFYGANTCFEGYIHKFADKGKFVYSLKAEANSYYYRCLHSLTDISIDSLKQVLSEEFISKKTLRELSDSLEDIELQCKPIADKPFGIVVLMACMRRLGMMDNEIVTAFRRALHSNCKNWLLYFYPGLLFFKKLKGDSVCLSDNEGRRQGFYFKSSGRETIIGTTTISPERSFLNEQEFLNQILSIVIQ